MKSRLIGKDPDAGKDWEQEEKWAIEAEMVGCHHWLSGHEFEQTQGDSEGQGSLACYRYRVAKSRIQLSSWTTISQINVPKTILIMKQKQTFMKNQVGLLTIQCIIEINSLDDINSKKDIIRDQSRNFSRRHREEIRDEKIQKLVNMRLEKLPW